MLSVDGLRSLRETLSSDPDAARRFRELYDGSSDALDALAWRIDPTAAGPTGAQSPLVEKHALELIVHARPDGPDGERAREAATARLSELLEREAADRAALDSAILRFVGHPEPIAPDPQALDTQAQGTQASVPEAGETDAPDPGPVPDAPRNWRRPAPVVAIAVAALVLGGLILGALRDNGCAASSACAAGGPAASPSPTPTLADRPQLTGYDAVWDSLMGQYPDAVRPDVQVVRLVSEREFRPALAECLRAAGFPDAQIIDEVVQLTGDSPVQQEAYNFALFVCQLQYPVDPLAVFDRPQTFDEKTLERLNTTRMGSADPGSGRLLLLGGAFQVYAYQFTLPGEEPLICVELSMDETPTSSGTCNTTDQFRTTGLTPSGLIWRPNGDITLTAHF